MAEARSTVAAWSGIVCIVVWLGSLALAASCGYNQGRTAERAVALQRYTTADYLTYGRLEFERGVNAGLCDAYDANGHLLRPITATTLQTYATTIIKYKDDGTVGVEGP